MTLPPQVRGYLVTLEYGLIAYHVKRYGGRRFDLDQWTTARVRRRGDRIRNLLQCKCPLLAQSRHTELVCFCPLSGVKRTCRERSKKRGVSRLTTSAAAAGSLPTVHGTFLPARRPWPHSSRYRPTFGLTHRI